MRRFVVATTLTLAGLASPALAAALQPGEIAPTPALIARAQQVFPPGEHDRPEYHFRKSGGVVLICYYNGIANGGFCGRTPRSEVRRIDKLAEDTCRQGGPDAIVPHVLTGEAIVLNYACKGGHMTREAYDRRFDADGWMIAEWKPLP